MYSRCYTVVEDCDVGYARSAARGKGVVYATYTRHVLYLTAHNEIKGLPQRMGIRAHKLGCWRPCQQLRPFPPLFTEYKYKSHKCY